MGLIIRSSAIHAAGCYTTSPIRKGARVIEYTGRRLSKAEADQACEESPITYLFGLGDGSKVIDGHSMAMFINHSCDANCETSEENGRVWIRAIRNIAAFYRNIVEGRCDNPSARQAVDDSLTAVLGREAAARRCDLSMEELIRENRELEFDLTGLKA